jgi:hypothetical protein
MRASLALPVRRERVNETKNWCILKQKAGKKFTEITILYYVIASTTTIACTFSLQLNPAVINFYLVAIIMWNDCNNIYTHEYMTNEKCWIRSELHCWNIAGLFNTNN